MFCFFLSFHFCLWSVEMTKKHQSPDRKSFLLSADSLDISLISIHRSPSFFSTDDCSPSLIPACLSDDIGDKKRRSYQSNNLLSVVSFQRWRVVVSSLNGKGSSVELSLTDLCVFGFGGIKTRLMSDQSSGSRRWGPNQFRGTSYDLWPLACRFWFLTAQNELLSLHCIS